MSKYINLRAYLNRQSGSLVPLSFSQIEEILGRPLPNSANTHRAWWSNNPSNNVMTREWLAAGFETEQVDMEGQKLVFRRIAPTPSTAKRAPAPTQAQDISDLVDPPAGFHPLFGCMRGTITVAPGADLTEPADPDWGSVDGTDSGIAA